MFPALTACDTQSHSEQRHSAVATPSQNRDLFARHLRRRRGSAS